MNTVTSGLVAGAAGVTALNTVTYLDMVVRGRPASTVPEETIDSVAASLGVRIPGRGSAIQSRRTGLGALGGIAVGLGIAVGAGLVRRTGIRLSPTAGAVAIGAGAMAATDIPIAVRGISDPRNWSVQDWLSDIVPHLAYGAAVHAVLRQQDAKLSLL
ncbi:hypothetical protein ACH47B_24860 [Rhodococcus sp. NPDC019627]|uniref:hypothetical protein n=1 Tax=unclassified Rhodococcus (in: high G+C Gram-positive bacteria) TaxID=192944 RepID=UPI0033F4EAE8